MLKLKGQTESGEWVAEESSRYTKVKCKARNALEQTKPKDQLTITAPHITNKKENKNEKE